MILSSEQQLIVELLAPTIQGMIDHSQTHQAREALGELLDAEVADVLLLLPPRQRAVAFRLLPRSREAEVFTYLPADDQEQLLNELSNEQLASLFNAMDPDDIADTFEEMPGQLTNKVLGLMSPANRRQIQVILGYPPESVGRFMTPDFLTFDKDWTVGQALANIRKKGRDAESIHTLFVVDAKGRLLDEVDLEDLIFAEPEQKCSTLLQGQSISLLATDDRELAVRMLERYDRPLLPVVDRDDVLLGIVTFDDVADVAEEEATEDMQKLGGMEALDEPYISTSILNLVRKRGGWLLMLFLGQMFTISIMGRFEGHLQQAVILAIFIPMIIASGGNSGSQATTLVIRAMTLGEITLRDWWKVLRRELACGVLLGLSLGMVGLLRVHLGQWLGLDTVTTHTIGVAVTVGLSLIGVVITGTVVGSMLPFILRRLGLDPATASAPFVSTLVDLTGLLIYFFAAMSILSETLLKQ